jgi:cell division protein FtsW (lipid II flippase)
MDRNDPPRAGGKREVTDGERRARGLRILGWVLAAAMIAGGLVLYALDMGAAAIAIGVLFAILCLAGVRVAIRMLEDLSKIKSRMNGRD